MRVALSVISYQTTTSATSLQTCKFLYKHKEINGFITKEIAPDTWTANNNIQYSYGWLGIWYPILVVLYTEYCIAQSGKCITNDYNLSHGWRYYHRYGTKFDPENTKYQYLFDNLQQDFQRQISIMHQRSCQNRNNLLLLIEWLSSYNPILVARLLLQKNDMIVKEIKGKLNKLEFERTNAALEILAQNQEGLHPASNEYQNASGKKQANKVMNLPKTGNSN
ncbi:unnamed protein product [Dracunculus medinensis]|uniref:Uncharacterized protein n=1 Tax=Dracunculus medinensis TaxID=318479 RepID=A0A0N4UJL0_DRAME|nr:unnamed protein product [Dracunculus medinensis]